PSLFFTWISRSSSIISGRGCASWARFILFFAGRARPHPCPVSRGRAECDAALMRRGRECVLTRPRFFPLYLCFASAYLLSYVYRSINAVISPELGAVLGVGASSLGLLTGAYFVAFAAMQLPAGMLLDRYGP